MARDHARIELSIWSDDDWLDLTPGAQHLYFLLLTQPTLSYAGVADWRPNRLRAMASHWDTDDVKRAAEELALNLYIVVDEETEEVLVRSFVRNDGLMKQPNLAKAMVKAARSIASRSIRAVLAHELLRLREDQPDLKGWAEVGELLSWRSVDPSGYPTGYPSGNPSGKGEPNPSDDPSGDPSLTPYSLLPTPDSLLPTPAANAASDARKRAEEQPRADVEALCERLREHIERNTDKPPTVSARWRTDARLLLDKDGIEFDEAMRVLDWCQQDSFWMPNILSMPKFREKFAQLQIKSRQRQQQQQPKRTWVDIARGMSQQNNYVEATVIEQGELE